ncbi:SurA N-terminal domain-containing protein [Thalassotalea sp. 1_MG-2023]|uniref:SurA N-terminal domain-containing protein n=1 Tax=Thalassotalea sp. 1_MG-2023 TaxID=3062680 RepID=UPI0026E2835F|nr:SurA N-terminal domain-containing protein [Thalassotalea sp. 1_MG-2023]MDO6427984.1 SurA N-terminal domain-containing protein [Thalassotalea sp. 1_MG-2023]
MLENIRENSQGLVAKIILGFIILTFAVAGIGSYTNSVDTSIAEVNGVKISQASFDKAFQQQRANMAQQYGEMFETLASDASYMANFRNSIVDNLINQELIDQASSDLSIRVSDAQIKKTIREMPAFQVEGEFDNNRYLAVINQNGFYQSSDFRDYLRVEMTRRQLSQALVATEFSVPFQEKQVMALQNQKRDLRYAIISAEQFIDGVSVTDEEILQYYQANQARYQNAEKVKVDYITIDVNEIAKNITVSDQELQDYYQSNIANYRQEEQRRVSHILIENEDDEAAAIAKIEDIQTRLANGEEFAALAEELSADVFSGENGGDLEWIERGAMDEAFDDAAFALTEIGEVSDVVETDFGLHLIKLTALEDEKVKPFSDVVEDLRVMVSQNKAQDKYFELQQRAAELSFEVPDSLEDAAGAINVNVQTSDWLTKNSNSAPFDSPKAIEAAFSSLVLEERLNSDIIEVSDSLALVLRVNEYQAANVKPLDEVKATISETLTAQKAQTQAQTAAEELLASLRSEEAVDEQLAASQTSFEQQADVARYGSNLDANLVREAFKLPHPKEDTVSATTVSLTTGDYAVVNVTAVNESEETETAPRLAEQLTQQLAQSAYASYVEALKAEAKITRRSSIQASNQY